ncbi:hypothetical protein ABFV99_13160 [Cytobacillus horneckiae]|uniref:hypothetical protein n=1 Tax=Cytobacillus horneckiae TaxID=549687 RepID=UPI0034CFD19C
MKEIISMDEFLEIKNNNYGFIAITDKNLSKNCVHHVKCKWLTLNNFKMKVITSNRKNGSYYYADDPDIALRTFNKMNKCEKCF